MQHRSNSTLVNATLTSAEKCWIHGVEIILADVMLLVYYISYLALFSGHGTLSWLSWEKKKKIRRTDPSSNRLNSWCSYSGQLVCVSPNVLFNRKCTRVQLFSRRSLMGHFAAIRLLRLSIRPVKGPYSVMSIGICSPYFLSRWDLGWKCNEIASSSLHPILFTMYGFNNLW